MKRIHYKSFFLRIFDFQKRKFAEDTEKNFQQEYLKNNLKLIQLELICAFILYNLFSVLDYFADPEKFLFFISIRLGIVSPFFVCTIILSFTSLFEKIARPLISFVSLVAGAGIVVIIYYSQNQYINLMYYSGLIIIVFGIYTFLRLTLFYSALAGWGIYLLYVLMIVMSNKFDLSGYLNITFIGNNFFLISANLMGMFSNFYFEFYSRRDFRQRMELNQKTLELEAERNDLRLYHKKTYNDLLMAKKIQEQLIPGKENLSYIRSYFKPMEKIGGDFFDYIFFRELDQIGIFIADVAGHGIAAALITSMLKALILNFGNLKFDPASLLKNLNEVLYNKTGNNFITAFYGIYNRTSRELIYSNAGHFPPYIISDFKITTLNVKKSLPLAVFNNSFLLNTDKIFTNQKTQIEKNAKILFFTDGLIELRSILDNEVFFDEKIEAVLKQFSSCSIDDCNKILIKEMQSFAGMDDYNDDVCYIILDASLDPQ